MAADVDKTTPDDGSRIPPQIGHRSPGSGSWFSRGLWTLLLVAAVPLLAFGVKYYQDAQLLKRHVRPTSVLTLITQVSYFRIDLNLVLFCLKDKSGKQTFIRLYHTCRKCEFTAKSTSALIKFALTSRYIL